MSTNDASLSHLPFHGCNEIEFLAEISTFQVWDNDFITYLNKVMMADESKELNCKYFTETEFNGVCKKLTNVEISAFHVNIHSLNSNHRSLQMYLACLDHKFDVIVLSEIWATNIDAYSNMLPGYTFYYELPMKSSVGGVDVFVKSSFNFLVRPDLKLTGVADVEDIWFDLVLNESVVYIFGCIYRHPNQNLDTFENELEKSLLKITRQNKPCLIMGDINIDFNMHSNHQPTNEYLAMLLTSNFVPCIVIPTRITPSLLQSLTIFITMLENRIELMMLSARLATF